MLYFPLFQTNANASPPIPLEVGSTTVSAAAVAMAASMAFPPFLRCRYLLEQQEVERWPPSHFLHRQPIDVTDMDHTMHRNPKIIPPLYFFKVCSTKTVQIMVCDSTRPP